MPRKATGTGPRFVRYFSPLLETLHDLGGSAKPAEVYQAIAAKVGVADEMLAETMESGRSRFDNQVAWARFYLAKAGIIDASSRGVWTLTEKGRQTGMFSHDEALQLFKSVQAHFHKTKEDSGLGENEDATAAPPVGGL